MPLRPHHPWLALVLTGVLALPACGLPAGSAESAEGVFYAVVAARAEGDAIALWGHLHPGDRALLDKLVATERGAAALIEEVYQGDRAPLREGALASLVVGSQFDDGQALFLAGVPAEKAPLGFGTSLGARVVETRALADGRTQVRTRAGDALTASQADGRWYYHLPEREAIWLAGALAQAEANLRAVEESAAKLRRKGGAPPAPPAPPHTP